MSVNFTAKRRYDGVQLQRVPSFVFIADALSIAPTYLSLTDERRPDTGRIVSFSSIAVRFIQVLHLTHTYMYVPYNDAGSNMQKPRAICGTLLFEAKKQMQSWCRYFNGNKVSVDRRNRNSLENLAESVNVT